MERTSTEHSPYKSLKSTEFRCRYCNAVFKRLIPLRHHINANHSINRHNGLQDDHDSNSEDDESSLFSNESESDSIASASSINNSQMLSEMDRIASVIEPSFIHQPIDSDHDVTPTKDDNKTGKRMRNETINEPPAKKQKLDENIFEDIPFITTCSLEAMFKENRECKTEVNRQSSIQWKKLLNGDTNNSKPVVKKKNTNVAKCDKEPMCTTCHTYKVTKQCAQCKLCQNNKVGMPFCTTCDAQLSFHDYTKWFNAYDIDPSNNSIEDMSQYVILCQACCISCKEFYA